MRRLFVVWAAVSLLWSSVPARAGGDLSFDRVFSDTPAWGAQPSRILWSPDGRSFLYVLTTQNSQQPSPVWQYDVASGRARILIDPSRYGRDARTPAGLSWSPDGSHIVFLEKGTLYERDLSTDLDRVISRDANDVLWAPQGDALAYTHGADLYVAHLKPALRIERLTYGGAEDSVLDGDLDWVYPEELSTQHGFAWSPDGTQIAYMRMDERGVTNFPIVDFLPHDNGVSYQRYPLAGERNPQVSLHLVNLESKSDRTVYDAGPQDEYLPYFGWKPSSDTLVFELLDRSQKRARVFTWTAGVRSQLLEERDARWVDAIPLPLWTSGGSSLWVLARDNVQGLYLRDAAGSLKRLNGAYRVETLLSLDANRRTAYVTAAYPTRRDRSLIAIPLAGGQPDNLTPSAGAHAVALSPGNDLFVDTHSTLNDPPQTDVVEVESRSVRATIAPRNDALASDLLPTEMLSVDSEYGKLDAVMMRPPDFNPTRKYPVIVYVYGGPEAPTTANVFGNMRGLYHQLLARSGFIVFSIDGPASQIDNEAHVRLLYHNLGPASLAGQEIGVAYLRSLPYVDPSRIGIWGWSFGGYETAYALTHSDLFKAGAAGAPVTDWRLYDSIYTERYMGSPQSEPQAYETSSVLSAAQTLHGDLLISHGTSDDNVHMANSIALLQSAISSDETHVDFMAYPRQRHGFSALADQRQVYRNMLNWWLEHL